MNVHDPTSPPPNPAQTNELLTSSRFTGCLAADGRPLGLRRHTPHAPRLARRRGRPLRGGAAGEAQELSRALGWIRPGFLQSHPERCLDGTKPKHPAMSYVEDLKLAPYWNNQDCFWLGLASQEDFTWRAGAKGVCSCSCVRPERSCFSQRPTKTCRFKG